jgi:hypothetical protein
MKTAQSSATRCITEGIQADCGLTVPCRGHRIAPLLTGHVLSGPVILFLRLLENVVGQIQGDMKGGSRIVANCLIFRLIQQRIQA